MPLDPMTDAEINDFVDKMDADLALQMNRNDISRHTMAALAKNALLR